MAGFQFANTSEDLVAEFSLLQSLVRLPLRKSAANSDHLSFPSVGVGGSEPQFVHHVSPGIQVRQCLTRVCVLEPEEGGG